MSTRNTPSPMLTEVEARILGSLIEKAATTPDAYPLTLNNVQLACNQKTSREPVMQLEIGEIGHALRVLEPRGLVKSEYGARAERYLHRLDRVLDLTPGQTALLGLLMLRGAQTVGRAADPQRTPASLRRRQRCAPHAGADGRTRVAAGADDRPRGRPARGPLRAPAVRRAGGARTGSVERTKHAREYRRLRHSASGAGADRRPGSPDRGAGDRPLRLSGPAGCDCLRHSPRGLSIRVEAMRSARADAVASAVPRQPAHADGGGPCITAPATPDLRCGRSVPAAAPGCAVQTPTHRPSASRPAGSRGM